MSTWCAVRRSRRQCEFSRRHVPPMRRRLMPDVDRQRAAKQASCWGTSVGFKRLRNRLWARVRGALPVGLRLHRADSTEHLLSGGVARFLLLGSTYPGAKTLGPESNNC